MIFKWEYRTLNIPGKYSNLVNNMVQQGWTIVSMGPVYELNDTVRVIFKRRKWFWQNG